MLKLVRQRLVGGIIIVRKHKGKIDHRILFRYRFSLEEKCVNWWWINKRRELWHAQALKEMSFCVHLGTRRVLRWSLTIWKTACSTMDVCNRGTALLAFPLTLHENFRSGQWSLILTASIEILWHLGSREWTLLAGNVTPLALAVPWDTQRNNLKPDLKKVDFCIRWICSGVRTSTETWRGRIVFSVWKTNFGLCTRVRPQKL